MNKDEMVALARKIAASHGLPADIVCGMIEREDGDWNTWAVRYEPAFMSKYIAPLYVNNQVSATEAYSRAMSWGLMQIMGETARELGFEGEFLSELCDPETGIEFGCRKLSKCFSRCGADVMKALEMYNGGANPKYAAEVVKLAAGFRNTKGGT